jgi:hypothetical protein
VPAYPYKTKDGEKWRYVINLPRIPGSTKRPQVWGPRGYDTKTEAEAAEAIAKAGIQGLPFEANGNLKHDLTSLMARRAAGNCRIKGRLVPRIEPTTHGTHMSRFDNYIFPFIGHLPTAKAATNEVMMAVYATLQSTGGRSGKPIAYSTVAIVHGTLMAAYKMLGMDVSGIDPPVKPLENPFDREDAFAERTWSPEQCQQFLDHLEGHPNQLLYLIIMITGLRRGEAVGLQWKSFLPDRSAIRVQNQITKLAGQGVHEKPPKNNSYRLLPLGEVTTHRLKELHDRVQPNPDDYVFLSPVTGRAWEPNSITEQFKRLCERTGLPYITLHGLRHSLATNAHNSGAPAKARQTIMGHKSDRTTDLYYTHGQLEVMRAITGGIERAVLPPSPVRP